MIMPTMAVLIPTCAQPELLKLQLENAKSVAEQVVVGIGTFKDAINPGYCDNGSVGVCKEAGVDYFTHDGLQIKEVMNRMLDMVDSNIEWINTRGTDEFYRKEEIKRADFYNIVHACCRMYHFTSWDRYLLCYWHSSKERTDDLKWYYDDNVGWFKNGWLSERFFKNGMGFRWRGSRHNVQDDEMRWVYHDEKYLGKRRRLMGTFTYHYAFTKPLSRRVMDVRRYTTRSTRKNLPPEYNAGDEAYVVPPEGIQKRWMLRRKAEMEYPVFPGKHPPEIANSEWMRVKFTCHDCDVYHHIEENLETGKWRCSNCPKIAQRFLT